MKKFGIDLGSRYVKTATFDNNEISFNRYDTVEFYKNYIKRDDGNIFIDTELLGLSEDYSITATGYGRNLMSFANAEIISEIKAHFRGASYSMSASDFILIDIGGQDSKVIFAKEGYVEDFVMNDKCAASTGRFAENASSILGLDVDTLSNMTDQPADLTTTCAVFCESEIINLMAKGIETNYIAAGINKSIAKRLLPLIKSFKSSTIFASGGVANNTALISFLSDMLQQTIIPVQNPQYNGAIGCLGLNLTT